MRTTQSEFVCLFCLFVFFLLRKTKSEFYLSQNTNVYSSKKIDDPFCETDLKNFYTSKIHGGNTGQTFRESDLASPAEGALDFDNDNVRGELYQFKLRFVK